MNKSRINSILFESFRDNGSIQFVVKQDARKEQRLKLLIDYSIFCGEAFGEVFLNDDQHASAIILDSAKKRTTLGSLIWEVKLLFGCIGIGNVLKVLKRESAIKKTHPDEPFIHLWYIGVDPAHQGKGLGTTLLTEILEKYGDRVIHLETSNPRNIAFYERKGFKLTRRLDELGYPLMIFQRRPVNE